MKTAFHGKSKLLVSAVAALFATVAYTAFADDAVKPGGNTTATQGRSIDDVKAQAKRLVAESDAVRLGRLVRAILTPRAPTSRKRRRSCGFAW